MKKEINNLKSWFYVKNKTNNISQLNGSDPNEYMYQLSNGIYYPTIKITDIPNNFKIKFG
jgi:hypothetical protein